MTRAKRADVARLAGVSSAVVSYVLNGGPRPVAEATRARVLAAVDELRYRPNASARALRLARTNVLGLLIPDITNPYFSEFALRLQDHAYARGYGLMIANTGEDGVKATGELRNMLGGEVDGIAIYSVRKPETLKAIVKAGMKVVLLDWHLTDPNLPSVGIDDYGATRQAVEHLLSHGHREVGLIAGTGDLTQRQQAWSDVMVTYCTPDRMATLKAVGDFSREGGFLAALDLLQQRNPPKAIFVSSDVQAIGALRAVQHFGLRIPADVAIVSLDGTEASAFTYPSLTAIQVPLDEIAKHCIDRLTALGSDEKMRTTVPHQLVTRESCGCDGRQSGTYLPESPPPRPSSS
jgi:LacI family transcriptional regulator